MNDMVPLWNPLLPAAAGNGDKWIVRGSGTKALVSETSAKRSFHNGKAESVRYSVDVDKVFLSACQRAETVSNMTMKTLLCNFFMSERSLLASVVSACPHFRRQAAGVGFLGENHVVYDGSSLSGG